MWYGEPLMEDADLPAPQSRWEAIWPPQAMIAVALVGVNDTWKVVSLVAAVRSPWIRYWTAQEVAPKTVMTPRLAPGTALKLFAGIPGVIEPVEDGAGRAQRARSLETPDTPSIGLIGSCACPVNRVCDGSLM